MSGPELAESGTDEQDQVLAAMARDAGISAGLGAGHSLGEYTALAAAGAIDRLEGMRLVLERGRLMAQARRGTMAAVLGLDQDLLRELCEEANRSGEVCVVANDNCPGQLVISGTVAGVEQVGARAKGAGAKKVVGSRKAFRCFFGHEESL